MKIVAMDPSHLPSGFPKDERNSLAVHAAHPSVVAVAVGTEAVDMGRIAVSRAQMQNVADASKRAGATRFDGWGGAPSDRAPVALSREFMVCLTPPDARRFPGDR